MAQVPIDTNGIREDIGHLTDFKVNNRFSDKEKQ